MGVGQSRGFASPTRIDAFGISIHFWGKDFHIFGDGGSDNRGNVSRHVCELLVRFEAGQVMQEIERDFGVPRLPGETEGPAHFRRQIEPEGSASHEKVKAAANMPIRHRLTQ